MPVFNYKAVTSSGGATRGTLTAESAAKARRLLREQNLLPTEVEEVSRETRIRGGKTSGRLSPAVLERLAEELALLLKAGIPLPRCLTHVSHSTTNANLSVLAHHLSDAVSQGKPLSEALRESQGGIPLSFCQMVQAGEKSGHLAGVFQHLASHLHREAAFRRKLTTALAYPLLVLGAGMVTVVFLMGAVVPSLVALFQKSGLTLPLPTRLLLGVWNHGEWVLGAILGLIVLGWGGLTFARKLLGQRTLDEWRFRLPLFGSLWEAAEVAQAVELLALMLQSRIPGVEALQAVALSCRTALFREEWQAVAERVEEGASLAQGVRERGSFPDLVAEMAAAGEESGALDETMAQAAEALLSQADFRLTLAASLAEPAAILAVGLAVGFLVAALLLPLFQMSAAIR